MTYRIDANHKPDDRSLVFSWERSLDPWHADAFPDGLKHAGTGGKRKAGWLGLDWVGNPLIFIADGDYKEKP